MAEADVLRPPVRFAARARLPALQAAVVAVVVLAWWAASASGPYWAYIVSSPANVGATLLEWSQDGERWHDLWVTLQEAVLGYLLGIVAAVVAVALLCTNDFVYSVAKPFIGALNAMPKPALAPLFIIWLGITLSAKVYFVATAVFFIVFYGVALGVRSIGRDYLVNARLLGASRLWILGQVYVPAVFVWLMSSLRLATTFALLTATIAEYMGSNAGVGYQILVGQANLDATRVLAGVIVIAAVSLVLDTVLRSVEAHYSAWRLF